MCENQFYFAAFSSRTQTMQYFELLRSLNIRANIINTPREASLGCGISVKLDAVDYSRARSYFNQCQYSCFLGWFYCKRVDRFLYIDCID